MHRTEHAVTVRDQLGTKRRRLFDEVILGRHGPSPIAVGGDATPVKRQPAREIHRSLSDEFRRGDVSESIRAGRCGGLQDFDSESE
jgi:hypothetical protein